MKFQEQLQHLGACQEAIEWVGDYSFEMAWELCDRAEWMAWLIGRVCTRDEVRHALSGVVAAALAAAGYAAAGYAANANDAAGYTGYAANATIAAANAAVAGARCHRANAAGYASDAARYARYACYAAARYAAARYVAADDAADDATRYACYAASASYGEIADVVRRSAAVDLLKKMIEEACGQSERKV